MRFQILSMSGGGYLGLFTVKILAEIERKAGRPIGQCFDLICGTSIGGIVALGLSAEVSAHDILTAFEENGETIFPSSRFRKIRRFFRPKHDQAPLRTTVESILGDRVIGDAVHRVLVPAVNMTKGQIQMFKTPHHPVFERDHKLRMVDVALATSAAPTFFPMAQINDWLFADGGLFANSPDLCGVHEASQFLGRNSEDIHVLSLGTTTSQFSLGHSFGTQFGAWQWVFKEPRLFTTVIAAQQQLTGFMMKHQFGDRYLRVDKIASQHQVRDLDLDLADHNARRTILGIAEGVTQELLGDRRLAAFLAHRPPPPEFFHGPNANTPIPAQ